MADIYLDSVTGDDADDGSTRALAKATLQAAITAAGADGRVFIDDGHAETGAAALVLTMQAVANAVTVISVDFAGTADPSDPVEADESAGAKVETTGNNTITINNSGYLRGITFDSGVGGTGGNAGVTLNPGEDHQQIYETCAFRISDTDNGSNLVVSLATGSSQSVSLKDSTVRFANSAQSIRIAQGIFSWEGGGIEAGGTDVDTLFDFVSESAAVHEVFGVDLSGLKATANLITGGAIGIGGIFVIRNCKLPTSWTGSLFSSALTAPGFRGEMINCDDSDTNYRLWIEDWLGTIRDETTVYRSGGASDGTTNISHKYSTFSTPKFITPFRGHSIESEANFDDIGSALTATLHYMHDGANALKTKEIWGRVEYLGTSGFPLALFADDAPVNVLSADADQSTSTADWDDGVSAWATSTVYSVGDFVRRVTGNGTVMIATVGGTSDASTEPTWPAEGSTVVDGGTLTWRVMRREKIDVAFTPQEKGVFQITPHIGKASVTTLFLDPLPDVV